MEELTFIVKYDRKFPDPELGPPLARGAYYLLTGRSERGKTNPTEGSNESTDE
jgi:hypothetical protein